MIVAEVGTVHNIVEFAVNDITVFVIPDGLFASVRIVAVIYHTSKQVIHSVVVVADICRCRSGIKAGRGRGRECVA